MKRRTLRNSAGIHILIATAMVFAMAIIPTGFVHASWLWPFSKPIHPYIEQTDLQLLRTIQNPRRSSEFDHVHPNELQPQDMLAVTREAPRGTYVVVGTERGFIGTALNNQFERTVFVDHAPEIVMFNRVNIALLQIAESPIDYAWLRTQATVAEVKQRLSRQSTTLTIDMFAWYHEALRGLRGDGDLLVAGRGFIDDRFNYVTNPALTKRLMLLAKQGRLSAHLLELANEKEVVSFGEVVLRGHTVSLIDLSNAWWHNYAGLRKTRAFIHLTASRFDPKALILVTNRTNDKWGYTAFPAAASEYSASWKNVLRTLKESYKQATDGKIPDSYGRTLDPFAGVIDPRPHDGPYAGVANDALFDMINDHAKVATGASFVKPNERDPDRMLPVTSHAPGGTYVSVGTERSFIGLALNKQLDRGLFIDRDPRIVLFNRINIGLLKVATSYEDYFFLRTRATPAELQVRLKETPSLASSDLLRWFTWGLRFEHGHDFMAGQYLSIPPGANYVLNRALCERLMILAKADRIQADLVDIENLRAVEAWRVANFSRATQHTSIGLIDLSNAWWKRYAGIGGAKSFIQKVSASLHPEAVVVVTQNSKTIKGWHYIGFAADAVATPVKWAPVRMELEKAYEDAKAARETRSFGQILAREVGLKRTCEAAFK